MKFAVVLSAIAAFAGLAIAGHPSLDVVRAEGSTTAFSYTTGDVISFGSTTIDTLGNGGPGVVTEAGLYHISSNFWANSQNSSSTGALRVNGTAVDSFFMSGGNDNIHLSSYVELEVGDVIDVAITNSTSGITIPGVNSAGTFSNLSLVRINAIPAPGAFGVFALAVATYRRRS